MFQKRPALSLEFLAHWVGGVSLTELGRLHGTTPRRLSELLKGGFGRLGSWTARYDGSAKQYRTTVPSRALHGPKTAGEAVCILQAACLWNDEGGRELVCAIADVRGFRREPAPDVFRTLLAGCTRRQAVEVTYLAKTGPHSLLFSPHTLVVGTFRNHFRGYSAFERQGEQRWWDLVPSRVVYAELRHHSSYVGGEQDAEWHAQTSLRLRLHDDLPLSLRDAIRFEHGIEGDDLVIGPIREALVRYVLADHENRRYGDYNGPAWMNIPADGARPLLSMLPEHGPCI